MTKFTTPKVAAETARDKHREIAPKVACETARDKHRKIAPKVAAETAGDTHGKIAAQFDEFRPTQVSIQCPPSPKGA